MSIISSVDALDSGKGKNVVSAEPNATGALCRFQEDSQPITTFVQQATEQNPLATGWAQQAAQQKFGGSTNFVQQAAEQNARDNEIRSVEFVPGNFKHFDKKIPSTNLVQEAVEQNANGHIIRNVEAILGQNFEGTRPSTNLVQEAAEQNSRDHVIRNVEAILNANFKNFDVKEPSTSLVQEAAEQNSRDHVIRNVEAILSENFKNFDAKEPVTNLALEATEQKRDQNDAGISKFFSQDLETNLMDNVSQVLARGNAMELLAAKSPPFHLGPVGELQGLDPKDFWHSQNDKADLSKYLKQNLTAVKQVPESMDKAIEALEQRIAQNRKDVKSGKPLDVEQTDRMRQMAENAALIKLAVADSQRAKDPKAANNLVLWNENSVTELIRIAENHGANKDNIQQLKTMVEDFNKR